MAAHVASVEDHGVWRGKRSWTVHVVDGEERAAVSVTDLEDQEAVEAEALERFATRRRPTEAERDAMQRTNEALRKGFS